MKNIKNPPTRLIVFKSRKKEIVLDASDDDKLSESCLTILRQRFHDETWHYKPYIESFSTEEQDFVNFWETSNINTLPELLLREGVVLYNRLQSRISEEKEDDENWVWYRTATKLLSLPESKAIGYRIPYKGVYLPTSFYLLMKRRDHEHEDFYLMNPEDM